MQGVGGCVIGLETGAKSLPVGQVPAGRGGVCDRLRDGGEEPPSRSGPSRVSWALAYCPEGLG